MPIIASGSAGSIIGALSFGLTSITDWGIAWWMSSIQLLCGWAAGALPQNRATARAAFFDALWSARDLQDVGSVFVQQLPAAMADQVCACGGCVGMGGEMIAQQDVRGAALASSNAALMRDAGWQGKGGGAGGMVGWEKEGGGQHCAQL